MVRKVSFFTADGHQRDFHRRLQESDINVRKTREIKVASLPTDITAPLCEGQVVVVDTSALSGLLETMPPQTHENWCRLHRV